MRKTIFSVTALFATLGSASAADVYLTSLRFGGSGCAPLTSTGSLYDVNNDGFPDQFQVIFSDFVAEQGYGVPLSQRRRNCNITVGMHLPQGFQFSIANVRYIGYADLPFGVTGRHRSTYEFPFYSNEVTLQSFISGDYQGEYSRQDDLGIASAVWSPCGLNAPFNIRTSVALEGPSYLQAAMTSDQVDGRVRQIYGFRWRQCR